MGVVAHERYEVTRGAGIRRQEGAMTDSGRRSLRKSFAWVFVGNISFAASQFFLTTLVVRELGPESLGELTLCLSIVAPLLMASSMQLRGIIATDAQGEFAFGHYWGLRLLMLLVLPIGGMVAGRLAGFDRATWLLLWVVIGMKTLEGASEVLYGQFQRSDRMDRIGVARMLRGMLLAGMVLMGVLFMGNLLLALAGTACLWFLVLVGYEVPQAFKFGAMKPRLRPAGKTWTLFLTALPMAGVLGLNAVSTQIPVYLLVGYWGEVALGRYAAVAQFMLAAALLTGPMGQVAAPRLAQYFYGNPRAFWRLFWKLQILSVAIGVSATLGGYFLGSQILSFVVGPEFEKYGWLLALLGLVVGVRQADAFAGTAVTAARIFRLQFFVRIGTTLGVLGLGWLWIRSYGLWAMPWVLMIAPVVSVGIYIAAVRVKMRRMILDRVAV